MPRCYSGRKKTYKHLFWHMGSEKSQFDKCELENQVSEGWVSNLSSGMADCTKNPGHGTFIPIESFNSNDLPEGYRDNDLYQLIKATADLTVKISIRMTSQHRPDFRPNTRVPYYLSDMKGSRNLRSGSGKVGWIEKFTGKGCPCSKCKRSDNTSKRWWKIFIYTAAQVLFDNDEASHTRVNLFFDNDADEGVLLNEDIHVCDKNVECDRCLFYCVTCDTSLAVRLNSTLERFSDVRNKVYARYRDTREKDKLNFIVSHPHGGSKRVSLGQWVENRPLHDDDCQYTFTYTTSTCPGSSGAYIHCMGFKMWGQHFHSGSLQSGLSCSGFGFVYD